MRRAKLPRVTRFRQLRVGRDRQFAIALAWLVVSCGSQRPGLERLATSASQPETDSVVACVEMQPEARYRNNGYDHLVHLRSRCDRRTTCTVATDVNPTPVDVTVDPHQTLAVLTFRGSPAREFTPDVSCRFAR